MDTQMMTRAEAQALEAEETPRKRRGLRLLLIGAGVGLAFTAGTMVMDQFTASASASTLPVEPANVQTPVAPDAVAAAAGTEADAAAIAEQEAAAAAQAEADAAAAAAEQEAAAIAEQEAAAAEQEAAAAAELEAAATTAPADTAAGVATTGGPTTLSVTGYCADPSCAQAVVDSHDMSLVDYGTGYTAYSGHNYGPAGIIASLQVGDVVNIEGVGAGTFQIVSTQYVSVYATTDEVNGLALQTCVGGDQMVVHYIERIG